LFSEEASKTQELIRLTRDLVKASAKTYSRYEALTLDPNLRLLNEIFIYLRSHTIDKLNSLRKIHRDAVVIVAEAQQCEKYDQMLRVIMRNRNVKYRRAMLKERLADLNAISLTMRDVDKKAKDIDKTINILEENTKNMLKILQGYDTGEIGLGKVSLPKLLIGIKGMYSISSMASIVLEMKKIIKDLIRILEAELAVIPSLYDNIHKIEIRERRIVRLMKQTRVRAT